MKKILLALILAFGCNTLIAQNRQGILKVLETQRRAWNAGNIDGFMQSYWHSDSLLFVGKAGPNYGWQTTLDNYKKRYPDKEAMGILDFKVIKLNLLGTKDAFMLGAWHLKRKADEPGGYFTLWFRKFKTGWKIVADHTS